MTRSSLPGHREESFNLPTDVVCSILPYVARPDLLRSVSLIDRNFAGASRPYVFRRITIDVNDQDRFNRKLEFLCSRPDLRDYVRQLDLTSPDRCRFAGQVGRVSTFSGPNDPLLRLENAISEGHFSRLKKLNWTSDYSIPPTLLEVLQANQPTCLVSIARYSGTPLPSTSNLVSLNATAHLSRHPFLSFERILLQSPRLRTLDIGAFREGHCREIHLSEGFEVASFLQYDPQSITAGHNNGGYPPLEELILRDIKWAQEDAMAVRERMCWTHLRRLELRNGGANRLLSSLLPAWATLPALEEFRMGTAYTNNESRDEYVGLLNQFLESMVSGLQELHVEAPWHGLLPMILERHGHTLRSLALHDQAEAREEERAILGLADMERLGVWCVELRHLSLDLDSEFSLRGTGLSEPKSLSTVINSDRLFPKLRHLTLWTPPLCTVGYFLEDIVEVDAEEIEMEEGKQEGRDTEDDYPETPVEALRRCGAATILDPSLGESSLLESTWRGKLESVVVKMGEQSRPGPQLPALLRVPGRPHMRVTSWLQEEVSPTQVRLEKAQEQDVSVRVHERGVHVYSVTSEGEWREEQPRDEEWSLRRDSSQLDVESDAVW